MVTEFRPKLRPASYTLLPFKDKTFCVLGGEGIVKRSGNCRAGGLICCFPVGILEGVHLVVPSANTEQRNTVEMVEWQV